jgi:hypothetical protein
MELGLGDDIVCLGEKNDISICFAIQFQMVSKTLSSREKVSERFIAASAGSSRLYVGRGWDVTVQGRFGVALSDLRALDYWITIRRRRRRNC